TFFGGLPFAHSFLHLLIDVLRYHNTIIHHQAGGQYDGQQRKHVNGIPHYIHDEKRTNQTHGDVDQWTKGNQPVAEEEIDDQYHQHDGDDQRFFYFENRAFDKFGLVERDINTDVVGNIFFNLFKAFVEFITDLY